MSPKVRKANGTFAAVKGYPDLELDTRSGIYYVRKFVAGKGELFKTTRQKTVRKAQTAADVLLTEFRGRKRGLRNARLKVTEACDLVLADLKEQTETFDDEGHPIRRLSTYENKDLPFLRDKTMRVKKKRKGMRTEGVIRELFGDKYVDEIDEQFWKAWAKRTGRKHRRLGDIAKYLSLVLTHAFEEQYLARKPRIRNPDKHKKKAQLYSADQVVQFFTNAEPVLQDLIVIGSENPLRPHENREVKWEMITISTDAAGLPVVIYKLPAWFTKTEEDRELMLTPNAAAVVVRRHLANQAKPLVARSEYLFPAPKDREKPLNKKHLSRMWARMKEKMLEQKIEIVGTPKFHWFRHTVYNFLLVDLGKPLAAVSQVGGTSMKTLNSNYLIADRKAAALIAQGINYNFKPSEEKKKDVPNGK